jgi:hypothetical protein
MGLPRGINLIREKLKRTRLKDSIEQTNRKLRQDRLKTQKGPSIRPKK